jgi:hypothetical protein
MSTIGTPTLRATFLLKGSLSTVGFHFLTHRDEQRMASIVSGFNSTVNALKEEIQRQKGYHQTIQNLEKKHLQGVAGIQ